MAAVSNRLVRRWLRFGIAALGVALALAITQAAVAGTAADFAQPVTSPEPVGSHPLSVAVGDFNEDAKPDLAVANNGSTNVTILLGDGSGNFAPTGTSPETVGGSPRSVAAAEFNGDGNLDLAVAYSTGIGSIAILLGDGTGNFTPAPTSPEAAGNPWSIAASDFNGDGNLDVVFADQSGDGGTYTVGILLGDGTGNFTPATTSPESAGGHIPRSVIARDFNGDGKPDLAVVNSSCCGVTILIGDGTGDFNEAPTSPEAAANYFYFRDAAAADFNGDGKLDLAVVAADTVSDVPILLGDGTGNFTPAPTSPEAAGTYAYSVVSAELNGDGQPDLAVANEGSDDVTILLGDGTGNFIQPGTSPEAAGDGPIYLVAADFIADAKPDLAVANSSSDNITILLNQTSNADLALSKSDSPDPVAAGRTLTYTLTARNQGPDDATVATITDTLPTAATFVSASVGCTHVSGTVTCSLGTLPAGVTKQVEIRVSPNLGGAIMNNASLAAAEQDLLTANNSASEQTAVTAPSGNCRGVAVTIVGTSGDNTLVGTAGIDVIHALGGDDTIRGRSGPDMVCGGSGDDEIYARRGSQTIYGGSGDDSIFGFGGNDKLFGGADDDELNGGSGIDTCNGGSAADTAVACERRSGFP